MLAPPQGNKRDRSENPIVFLDVKVGDALAGRLLIEVGILHMLLVSPVFRKHILSHLVWQ